MAPPPLQSSCPELLAPSVSPCPFRDKSGSLLLLWGTEVGNAESFLPEVESRNVGSWSERMGWALLASWVTPTLPTQARVLSVLMWDPVISAGTLCSLPRSCQDPSEGRTEASHVPLGLTDTHYRYVCVYIYIDLYIDCI